MQLWNLANTLEAFATLNDMCRWGNIDLYYEFDRAQDTANA